MKKVILMLVMLFTMSIGVFANEEKAFNDVNAKKYEFNVNQRRLGCVLDMTLEQMEDCSYIFSTFEKEMEFAKGVENEDSRDKVAANAVKKNARWMRYILDEKQYRKYLMLLNLTLEHKGFDIEKINN